MNKSAGRPHSMKSELGSVQSGNSSNGDTERPGSREGEFKTYANHSEDYVFKLTYGYINKSTVGTEEAAIVKTYLEREGFTEWFAKKVKAHRSSQKKQEILNKLRNSRLCFA